MVSNPNLRLSLWLPKDLVMLGKDTAAGGLVCCMNVISFVCCMNVISFVCCMNVVSFVCCMNVVSFVCCMNVISFVCCMNVMSLHTRLGHSIFQCLENLQQCKRRQSILLVRPADASYSYALCCHRLQHQVSSSHAKTQEFCTFMFPCEQKSLACYIPVSHRVSDCAVHIWA